MKQQKVLNIAYFIIIIESMEYTEILQNVKDMISENRISENDILDNLQKIDAECILFLSICL